MLQHRSREPSPGIYRLVLPLPFPGLDRVNAYLLRDESGSTLVDCGIHHPSDDDDHGWADVVGALDAIDIRPTDVTRLVVTHAHIDHYGMAGRFVAEAGCELWMHREAGADLDAYRDPAARARRVRDLFADHGVKEGELEELVGAEDWRPFVSDLVEPQVVLDDGDTFVCGGRTWTVVHTPGHARSHICLWAADDRVLISGDHLLPAITPHIDLHRGGDEDPLGDFLESLRKIESLDPAIVLPGHGHPFEEGAARARAIARHHDRRLGSILQVIRQQPHTASEITDEIFTGTLLNFERRLALGEALAHLVYLLRLGEVEMITRADGTYAFKKATRRG